MSKKSRQRNADATGSVASSAGKGTRGAKGKKGKGQATGRQIIVETRPNGVPFVIVVLVACVMSAPSLVHFLDGSLLFDALMIRLFAALAVSWLLSYLIYAVLESMRPAEITAIVDLAPEQAYRALTGSGDGVLTGAVVDAGGRAPADGAPLDEDPFALAPIPTGPVVPPASAGQNVDPGGPGREDFVPGVVTEQRPA